MAVLVFAEHDNAALKAATLNAVTAAKQLGDVTILVAGSGCGAVAEAAAKVDGVSKVLVADDAAYGNGIAEEVAPLIAKLAETTGIEITGPTQPFVTFDGVPTRQDAGEAAFWRGHPRPEVQLFLKLNPRYSEGYGLVTLVPLTWKNLAVGAFRAATAGLRRRRN